MTIFSHPVLKLFYPWPSQHTTNILQMTLKTSLQKYEKVLLSTNRNLYDYLILSQLKTLWQSLLSAADASKCVGKLVSHFQACMENLTSVAEVLNVVCIS